MAVSAFSDARAHCAAAENTMDVPAAFAAQSSEVKGALLSGQAAWETSTDCLWVSPAVVTDGPHGVRLQAPVTERRSDLLLRLPCKVIDTGPRTGREVLQGYAGDVDLYVDRPVREIKQFTRS